MSDSTPRRFYIETFGCQMNVNDSEKVAGLLRAEGHEPVSSAAEADAVFVNTCAVRERAAEKLFHAVGRLRRLKRTKPDLKIAVGGCVPQLLGPSILERAPDIDLLVGPHNIARVPEFLARAAEGERHLVDLDRKADRFAVPDHLVAHSNPVRAYVTVMEGCNHVCSFCVVPRTRGPEVCRPVKKILAEVETLTARGVPEVMLLGQTVNAYQYGDVDFAGLLGILNGVPGLRRLRFTTSHPSHVSNTLAEALSRLDKACPYLHLPFQSGSDRILDAMRRGYSVQEYRSKVALLRGHVPRLALSSDVICGYPTETMEDFEATLALVKEIGFDGLFVFAYSPRPGTTAVRLSDDVPEDEKKRRVRVLNDLQQELQAQRNATRLGVVESVLVESAGDGGRLAGRTADFKMVHFDGPHEWLGQLVDVRVESSGANSFAGRAVERQAIH
jgi:tRNA-2-methylthio-N6-dimethylallyladenosine synthase